MKRFLSYLLLFLFSFIFCKVWAYAPEDCAKCHGEAGAASTLHISIQEFKASIHGQEIKCQDCHTGVINQGHESIKGSGAVDCNQCHNQENRHGLRSKSTNRPQCHSCHTKHGILQKDNPASSVHPRRLKETCKSCHKRECGEVDYLSWLPSLQISSHKKQDFSQAYEGTNCIGCHQGMAVHGEEGQLSDQDCHKCHLTAAGQSKLMGYIHPRADLKEQPETFAAAIVYQIVAVVFLWGGLRFCLGKLTGKIRGTK